MKYLRKFNESNSVEGDDVFDKEPKPVNYEEIDEIYNKWLDEGTIMTDYGLMVWIYKNYKLTKK